MGVVNDRPKTRIFYSSVGLWIGEMQLPYGGWREVSHGLTHWGTRLGLWLAVRRLDKARRLGIEVRR
jgi:hypothetical protein